MLERYLAKKLGGDEEFVAELIRKSRQGDLCIVSEEEPALPPNGAVIRDGNRYYLHRNWTYETRLIEQVERLSALTPPPFSFSPPADLLPEQLHAIQTALSRSFCLICGGPGTGKTHTAAALARLFAPHLHIVLAAPTGKAASHLARSVGSLPHTSASTLHRLLKKPGRIDADLVIVDEGSMIDVALWVRLLDAIGDATRLVVLGDPDQLPPIEAGTLFAEMAPLFGVSLSRCMRTDVPELHALANAIRTGNAAQMLQIIPPRPAPTQLYEQISPLVTSDEPNPEQALTHYKRLGLLNALRQGPHGVDALQQRLLEQMAPRIGAHWWALPVLVTANHSRLELYNGTLGILIGQGTAAFHALRGTTWFPSADGTLTPYPTPPPFEPALCLSIHKAQGSEFETVIALFPPGSERLGREALYTAVTRAKRQFIWVGAESTLREMVQNRSRRVSGFRDRL